MVYYDIKCKDLIEELKKCCAIQSVKVVYDSVETVKQNLNRLNYLCYLSVLDNTQEKEQYQKKNTEAKKIYKTKSCAIHFPDLSVSEMMEMIKCDIFEDYRAVFSYLKSFPFSQNCPVEILYISLMFLHEVGHWNQVMRLGRNVYDYMNMDLDAEMVNHNKSNKICLKIQNIIDRKGSNPAEIPEKVKKEIETVKQEYRKIPKEAEADKYAIEMLQKIDFPSLLKALQT